MNYFKKIKEYIWFPTKQLEDMILNCLESRNTSYTLDELYEALPVKGLMFTYTRLYDVILDMYKRELISRVVTTSRDGLTIYIARKV